MLIIVQPFLNLVQSIWNQVPSLKKVIIIGGEASGDNILSFRELLSKDAEPVELDIKDSGSAPVFHSFCQMGSILAPIYGGGSIVVIAQFS